MSKGRLVAVCGVLTALAAVLSAVERLFPLPMPGLKLGLAGIVTMIALLSLGRLPALCIVICRCLLGAVLGGGITGLFFSMTGGLLSFGVMILLLHVRPISLWGVSMAGAAAHNTGQVLAAVFLLNSTAPLGYLPVFLLLSIPTGLLTAALASAVNGRLRRITKV